MVHPAAERSLVLTHYSARMLNVPVHLVTVDESMTSDESMEDGDPAHPVISRTHLPQSRVDQQYLERTS
jgi:hypothetical protein